MDIRFRFGNTSLNARLEDNATAKDFYSLLPIAVTLKDYAKTEKIFYPEQALSKTGAPSGMDPTIGDITYYAPWGNIAIFYKDFGYAAGLIKLGSIEGNMGLFAGSHDIEVTIEPR